MIKSVHDATDISVPCTPALNTFWGIDSDVGVVVRICGRKLTCVIADREPDMSGNGRTASSWQKPHRRKRCEQSNALRYTDQLTIT